MTTYAELTQQILDYTEVGTDVLTSTITNDFIEHVENRLFREVDLDVFKSNQSANLASSNPFLSLPGGIIPTPESLGTIRTMQIFPASGTPIRTFLEQRDVSFITEYAPDRTDTGTPVYWAWFDHNSLVVAPTPDSAYNVELGITRLPTRLSSTNTETWLSTNAQSAMLYGCLAEAFKYLKGPAEMLQINEQSYQRAVQELAMEQQGRHRRDEYMHGALRTPIKSISP
jgi:hypothetical protein|tara:strand:- start:251 stop:934 length:684 start_codon:yes stop_codon:yes gene_type:complete